MKQLHLNDPSTLAKKHQGETNDRLELILQELRITNQLLADSRAELAELAGSLAAAAREGA